MSKSAFALLCGILLLATGCMSEGGSNSGAQVLQTDGSETYKLIFLPTGRLISASGLFDPQNNPLLRDQYLAFSRVPAGDDYLIGANSNIIGVPATSQEGIQTAIIDQDFFIGTFEVTQRQWRSLQQLGNTVPVQSNWNLLNPLRHGSHAIICRRFPTRL